VNENEADVAVGFLQWGEHAGKTSPDIGKGPFERLDQSLEHDSGLGINENAALENRSVLGLGIMLDLVGSHTRHCHTHDLPYAYLVGTELSPLSPSYHYMKQFRLDFITVKSL
jgi:hypothetical protein